MRGLEFDEWFKYFPLTLNKIRRPLSSLKGDVLEWIGDWRPCNHQLFVTNGEIENSSTATST